MCQAVKSYKQNQRGQERKKEQNKYIYEYI